MAINKNFIVPDSGLEVKGASTFSNNVTIAGDLTVSGTTTYVNTATLNIADNVITLNADLPANTAPTENSGIEVNRGSAANVALRWSESAGVWTVTQDGTNFGRIHSKLTDIALGTDTSGNYVATITSGNGLTGSGTGEGSTPSLAVVAGAGIASNSTGVHVVAGNTQLISNSSGVWIDQSKIDHNSLSNYVADQHVAHTSVTLTAGAGLTGGGDISASRTFNVGAGSGITVNADDVAVTAGSGVASNSTGVHVVAGNNQLISNSSGVWIDQTKINHNALSNYVADQHVAHTSVTLTAGSGLTGGGDISSSRTFAVGAGNGITVNADDVAVTAGSGIASNSSGVHVVGGTGVTSNSSGVHIGQSVSNTANVVFAGLTLSNGVLQTLSQTFFANASVSYANITHTASGLGNRLNISTEASAGQSTPGLNITTGDTTSTGTPGSITIRPGGQEANNSLDLGVLRLRGGYNSNTTSGVGGSVQIAGGEHIGGGGGGTDVYAGPVIVTGGDISNTVATSTNKRPGSVYVDGGLSANVSGRVSPSIFIGANTSRPLTSIRIGSTASGNTILYANGGVGTSGQVLYSNGSSAYWSNLPADSDTLQSISDDTSTNATYYPSFVTSTSGAQTGRVSSTKLTFNPSTGFLSSTGVAITSALRETRTTTSGNAINLNNGSYFTHTVSGSTTFSVTNVPSTGTAVSFILDITNGGSQLITWWSGVKWPNGYPPALTTSGRDMLGFTTYDGGTTWSGFVLGYDVK